MNALRESIGGRVVVEVSYHNQRKSWIIKEYFSQRTLCYSAGVVIEDCTFKPANHFKSKNKKSSVIGRLITCTDDAYPAIDLDTIWTLGQYRPDSTHYKFYYVDKDKPIHVCKYAVLHKDSIMFSDNDWLDGGGEFDDWEDDEEENRAEDFWKEDPIDPNEFSDFGIIPQTPMDIEPDSEIPDDWQRTGARIYPDNRDPYLAGNQSLMRLPDVDAQLKRLERVKDVLDRVSHLTQIKFDILAIYLDSDKHLVLPKLSFNGLRDEAGDEIGDLVIPFTHESLDSLNDTYLVHLVAAQLQGDIRPNDTIWFN